MNFIYVQGKLLPQSELRLNNLERSYKFGDAVFERLRIENAQIFNLPFHIKRLSIGLKALKIDFDANNLGDICKKAIMETNLQNGYLRIQICRESQSKGYLPLANKSLVLIDTQNNLIIPSDTKLSVYSGIANVSVKAKTASSLNYVLASMEAKENNCDSAILLNHDGIICETANANIFWVINSKIYTPSLDLPLIPGSVQDIIFKQFDVNQVKQGINELINACEIFVTNSTVILQKVNYINRVTLNLTSSEYSDIIKKSILKPSNFS